MIREFIKNRLKSIKFKKFETFLTFTISYISFIISLFVIDEKFNDWVMWLALMMSLLLSIISLNIYKQLSKSTPYSIVLTILMSSCLPVVDMMVSFSIKDILILLINAYMVYRCIK